ncbi:GMP synthase [Vibrio profundum]|uniref:glutamine amidotransferase-related protein n=1 Tax=Vibrio profundum TaxID=2910247 RepID=UPI003D09A1AC
MKVGILQCDDVLAELQVKHGNYPAMFQHLLHGQDPSLELTFYRALDGELPKNIDECDAYITTGSKHSVNDDYPWITQLEDFVRQLHQHKKKLVGICFGHQLIAKALGGEVIQAPQGWGVGVATHALQALPSGASVQDKQAVSLLVIHQDQVVSLPKDTQVLAGSEFCPNYMLQVGKHFLGIQGHPEFNKPYTYDLMHARKAVIPSAVLDDAFTSLDSSIDSEVVTRWMLSFIHT